VLAENRSKISVEHLILQSDLNSGQSKSSLVTLIKFTFDEDPKGCCLPLWWLTNNDFAVRIQYTLNHSLLTTHCVFFELPLYLPEQETVKKLV